MPASQGIRAITEEVYGQYLNHIITCTRCYAPRERYCIEGGRPWEAYQAQDREALGTGTTLGGVF